MKLSILAAALIAAVAFWPSKPPSDAEMIGAFNIHRAAFEDLAALCFGDGQGFRPKKSKTKPDNADEYKALFAETGIVTGVSCFRDTAKLDAWSRGFSISGEEKFYLLDPPADDTAEIVESLDAFAAGAGRGEIARAYRKIDERWRLAYVKT